MVQEDAAAREEFRLDPAGRGSGGRVGLHDVLVADDDFRSCGESWCRCGEAHDFRAGFYGLEADVARGDVRVYECVEEQLAPFTVGIGKVNEAASLEYADDTAVIAQVYRQRLAPTVAD